MRLRPPALDHPDDSSTRSGLRICAWLDLERFVLDVRRRGLSIEPIGTPDRRRTTRHPSIASAAKIAPTAKLSSDRRKRSWATAAPDDAAHRAASHDSAAAA